MNQPHILLVEDEAHIAQGLVFNLKQDGCRVTHVDTGSAALAHFKREEFNLVILDLMLPDCNGLDVCRKMRQHNQQLPILMLTALSEEQDRIAGLREGADDYLTKPFSLDEFLLRVRGMLRRSGWYRPTAINGGPYRFGANLVDLTELRATTAQGEINLTGLECKMLETFFAAEGQVLARTQLLQSVWGVAGDTETRTLDNFIVRLRKYFEVDPSTPRYFQTVRGRGYRFVREPEADKE
ncbi:MAG: response regulator transcription factor [Desulfuromonadales bacterium]|nr:response regulator transcription factor [Desulfuromonadales bacterium]